MRRIEGFAIVVLTASAALADTQVPGSANPNLAGREQTYTCCSGDSAALQAPPEVQDVELDACDRLTFSVTGRVSYTPSLPAGNNPDGDQDFSMTNFGDGISAPLSVRANALFGVFLDDQSPTGKETPVRLDYGEGLSFVRMNAGLRQIFFIGDGLTSDSNTGDFSGATQEFTVPRGATRLFLGTGDGSGWYNNAGSFDVSVSSIPYGYRDCGDPVGPDGIVTSDALYILRTAVGSNECEGCLCDVDNSGIVSSTDALAVLRAAVGNTVALRCLCCEEPV